MTALATWCTHSRPSPAPELDSESTLHSDKKNCWIMDTPSTASRHIKACNYIWIDRYAHRVDSRSGGGTERRWAVPMPMPEWQRKSGRDGEGVAGKLLVDWLTAGNGRVSKGGRKGRREREGEERKGNYKAYVRGKINHKARQSEWETLHSRSPRSSATEAQARVLLSIRSPSPRIWKIVFPCSSLS